MPYTCNWRLFEKQLHIYILYMTYHIFTFNFPLVMEVGENGERKEFHGRHIWYIIYNHGTLYKMKFRYWSAIPWKRSYFIRSLIYNNVALYGNKKIIIYIYIHLFIYLLVEHFQQRLLHRTILMLCLLNSLNHIDQR